MRDWRTRLEKWVRVWDRLPELTRDCLPLAPPSDAPWPGSIPTCPALSDFFARCDGWRFGPYSLASRGALTAPGPDDWLSGSPGLELMRPGRWVVVGDHDYGHSLFWDADADEVFLYNPDDEERTRLGQTMDQFLDRLFRPSRKSSDESTLTWAEALTEADAVA